MCVLLIALSTETGLAFAESDVEPAARTEIGLFPLLGGSSDIGFGGGEMSSMTRLSPDKKPYLWRIESAAFVTFKPDSDWRSPYQDYWVSLVLPHARPGLRLTIRPSYTRETTLKYYGFGNASPEPSPLYDIRLLEYARTHPTLSLQAALSLTREWRVEMDTSLTYNELVVPTGSKLSQDLASPPNPEVRSLLGPVAPHAVVLFGYGFSFDTRDDELLTRRGRYDSVHIRVSPSGGSFFPYRYAKANLTVRRYLALDPNLTLAVRAVVDLLFGDAPFYELTRFEDTGAIGGCKGVRGVPAQRYYGKAKVFGNIELRTRGLPFTINSKPFALGAVLFADAGRVWADYARHPTLDGTGLGIHFGLGAGVRLQQGSTFVVSGDVAWSPDAHPLGAYFRAGEMF